MLVVAVDAAVGEQADEMQCLTVRRSVLYCAQQGRIFKKPPSWMSLVMRVSS